ncbi:FAD-dependent oxidoreductase [Streptomyces silvisoli]|uniref:FAD-dependent oxidoreductase n=1 Tax=Streptomyces silvisoli TaxID=3034235 RepID=A0ABT5ZJD2_9ACTN|nr:FAD-dependent oxidoreductase [Streptomyces silvisoli]MDF3289948.1 FAD-dependent oxidoreductase [Streptomyces silvisoli]
MNAAALPARTEVAIVGAGPTGLTLAVTLARAGIDFVLLDRQEQAAHTSRAGVVHARTLEVLDELGTAPELLARGRRADQITVRDGARQVLRVPFGGLPTRFPFALVVPQYETEDVLASRLRQLGGTVHRPYEVTAVAQDAEGATLTMASGETLRAAYVVGADGMHSVVREAAGIGFEGGSYRESFVLADVTLEQDRPDEGLALRFGAAGVFFVAPFPGGHYRVIATVDDAPDKPELGYVQGLLDTHDPYRGKIRELIWSSRFRIHHRVAERFRAGRVLVAGDAAHVHSPAGGQGMNIGIQDGYALGQALAEGRLETYEQRRRPVARRVVAFTDRMTRIVTGPWVVRHTLLPLVSRVPALRQRLAMELAELNYR